MRGCTHEGSGKVSAATFQKLFKHSFRRVRHLTVLQMVGLQVKLREIKREGHCWVRSAFLRNPDEKAVSTGRVKTTLQGLPPSLLVERPP